MMSRVLGDICYYAWIPDGEFMFSALLAWGLFVSFGCCVSVAFAIVLLWSSFPKKWTGEK